jgi:hypothetical protein
MRSYWGDRFYLVPYACGTSSGFLWKARRVLNRELAFAYAIDQWYDPSLDAFLHRLIGRRMSRLPRVSVHCSYRARSGGLARGGVSPDVRPRRV